MLRAAAGQALVPHKHNPPFYRQQQRSVAPPEGAHIELKPAASNVLLGAGHLEKRGSFVAAHPSHAGSGHAVRRGASPSQQQLLPVG